MKEEATAIEPGFTTPIGKEGGVEVLHRGKLTCTLRGREAEEFVAKLATSDPVDGQQLMARITGNYKHGTERVATEHPRNRP